jgi:hypothetical protein
LLGVFLRRPQDVHGQAFGGLFSNPGEFADVFY